MSILACLKCLFQHVLCVDFRMSYVSILACLVCLFWHVLCAYFSMSYVFMRARLASLAFARFARVARFVRCGRFAPAAQTRYEFPRYVRLSTWALAHMGFC